MNKTRRAALNALQDRITALPFNGVFGQLPDIISDLETLRDEEQEAFDNKPESLQTDDAQYPIDKIEAALELMEALQELSGNLDEAHSEIEEAKGQP